VDIRFTKMEGCGNDYVYISGFDQQIDPAEKPELVERLSDRHFGIGGDGVIFINPSKIADFEMEMWNADGTRGEMCGNGIRCVGKFVFDKGMTSSKEITVESFGKVKYLTLYTEEEGGKEVVTSVRVNMGEPILDADDIPVIAGNSPVVAETIRIDEKDDDPDDDLEPSGVYEMTCVSMGNPHAVIFCDQIDDLDLNDIGPDFEHHPMFPDRVNTEFVKILDRHTIAMRVWERGSGETLACGTGACASAVASILNGHVDEDAPVTVELLGGDLKIFWDRNAKENRTVYMTGPAEEVFEGEIRL
jgi:diaminopimelate epimerase